MIWVQVGLLIVISAVLHKRQGPSMRLIDSKVLHSVGAGLNLQLRIGTLSSVALHMPSSVQKPYVKIIEGSFHVGDKLQLHQRVTFMIACIG